MKPTRHALADWHAEDQILGVYVQHPDLRPMLEEALTEADFSRLSTAACWRVFASLQADDGGLDAVTAITAADLHPEMGGPAEVARIVTGWQPAEPEPTRWLAKRVRDCTVRRQVKASLLAALGRVEDPGVEVGEIVAGLDREMDGLHGVVAPRDLQLQTWAETMRATLDALRARARREAVSDLVATGWPVLDDALNGGLKPGELVVLAGRPAMGKSAVALALALNAARAQVGTLFVSLEMDGDTLALRGLASLARVPFGALQVGHTLGPGDLQDLDRVQVATGDYPLWIDVHEDATVGHIRSRIRQVKRLYPQARLVIVDYLQLMRGQRRSGDSREVEVAGMARGLKLLAKAENVVLVALAQLNRGVEARPLDDRRPRPSDLRESGALEQDADVILFPYRHEVYAPHLPGIQGQMEMGIAKHRRGRPNMVQLRWSGEFQSIEDAAAPSAARYDRRGEYE